MTMSRLWGDSVEQNEGFKGIMGHGCSVCEGQRTWTGGSSHWHMEMQLYRDR